MKSLVLCSNMQDEEPEIVDWMTMARRIADAGIIIVDSGSKDNTVQIARDMGAIVIENDIIKTEGYGPARNHLIDMAREHFPEAGWMMFLDADERIIPEEWHNLRCVKDYLMDQYDAVGFPRIDWHDRAMTKAENVYQVAPDWQCRMIRLSSKARYARKLHEQLSGVKQIYVDLNLPKINHFHRCAAPGKRAQVGILCAKLHAEDIEFGNTYPKHPSEEKYYNLYKKGGLL